MVRSPFNLGLSTTTAAEVTMSEDLMEIISVLTPPAKPMRDRRF
jgi:hypothetical protein